MKNLLYIIAVLFFISCGVSKTLQPVTEIYTVEEDKQLLSIIQPYKAQFEEEMSVVVAVAEYELTKNKPEGILNNFLADAIFEVCQNAQEDIQQNTKKSIQENPIDFCVLNYGGIRLPSLPQGDISKSMIYELLPFDNYMTVLNMSSDMLQQFFDHIAVKGGWPVSEQVQFKLDTIQNKAINIKINGESLNSNRTYQVVMPDYIANGGDECSMLKKIPQQNLNILLRDAMLDYLNLHSDTIAPILEKRIYYE